MVNPSHLTITLHFPKQSNTYSIVPVYSLAKPSPKDTQLPINNYSVSVFYKTNKTLKIVKQLLK
jgi:hypothetical protein